MSPLAEEAFTYGDFDVIVNREGEDIIGQLSDVLLEHRGGDRDQYLAKVPGITYRKDGAIVQTQRTGLVAPDFVELPDFHSIKDLNSSNPMVGAVSRPFEVAPRIALTARLFSNSWVTE
ncbi:MAG: hypothetical protein CM1200mP22_33110 [Dehalococcoidia bacterium]|nr:MAG: hypothetical protein CM1200mP22_33110 [Dehalococcoidia bacterium]